MILIDFDKLFLGNEEPFLGVKPIENTGPSEDQYWGSPPEYSGTIIRKHSFVSANYELTFERDNSRSSSKDVKGY